MHVFFLVLSVCFVIGIKSEYSGISSIESDEKTVWPVQIYLDPSDEQLIKLEALLDIFLYQPKPMDEQLDDYISETDVDQRYNLMKKRKSRNSHEARKKYKSSFYNKILLIRNG